MYWKVSEFSWFKVLINLFFDYIVVREEHQMSIPAHLVCLQIAGYVLIKTVWAADAQKRIEELISQ